MMAVGSAPEEPRPGHSGRANMGVRVGGLVVEELRSRSKKDAGRTTAVIAWTFVTFWSTSLLATFDLKVHYH